jgi:hypothetical protein
MNNLPKDTIERKLEIEHEKKIAVQIVQLFSESNFTIRQAKETLNITGGLLSQSFITLQDQSQKVDL